MTKSGLDGPYPLTFDDITKFIAGDQPGAYAIGHTDFNGSFRIRNVGRADSDLRKTLCNLIGSEALFKYTYLPTAEAAFQKECALYHDFSPPGNRLHPARLAGASWHCPFCSIYDAGWN